MQKEPRAQHVVAMVEDITHGVDIDGQRIMAFVKLQVDVENHDPCNANEGEKIVAIVVECVEVLIEGGALVPTRMMLLNDHDNLYGVSWPYVCKLVHCFLGFATWGGYNYDLII